MGAVNTSSSGNLYFDFRFKNQRCREYTKLSDTPANRRRMNQIMQRIEAEITLGSFDYGSYFPDSKRAAQFVTESPADDSSLLFGEFASTWFTNMQVSWRNSYRTTVETIIEKRLKPRFGSKVVSSIKKQDVVEFRASLAKVITRNNTPLSSHSINRHIKILYAILADAADQFDFTMIPNLKPLKEQKTVRISVNPIGRFGFIRSLFLLLFRPCQFYLK